MMGGGGGHFLSAGPICFRMIATLIMVCFKNYLIHCMGLRWDAHAVAG